MSKILESLKLMPILPSQINKTLNNLKIHWIASRYSIGGHYRRVYHYHIRKTAGTSLNAAFWNLADLNLQKIGRRTEICQNGFIFVRHSRSLIEQGHYFYGNSHRPAYTLQLPPKTFTITILRDPLKRVLSYYRHLVWVRDCPDAKQSEPYFPELQRKTAWLGSSFQDFLTQVPQENLLSQLHMFSQNYDIDEAAERILACSAVCFTESFSRDFEQLKQQIQIPSLQEKRERTFTAETQLEILPDELAQAREILEREFTLLAKVSQRLAKIGKS